MNIDLTIYTCNICIDVFWFTGDGEHFINITEFQSVNITSPNYPANYPNNLRCTWRITPCVNCSLAFRVIVYDVEPYDELILVKGDHSWHTKFLGKGDLQINYDGDILLEMKTDYSVSYSGFMVQFQHVSDTGKTLSYLTVGIIILRPDTKVD